MASLLLLLDDEQPFLRLRPDLPGVRLEIDVTNEPTSATRTWTDVTEYARQVSVRRGRENELAKSSAGRLTVVLSNSDRRFDPSYAAGPYYPNVKPARAIRLRAQHDGVAYNLFRGYTEDTPQEWPDGGQDALVRLTAADAFKVLNLTDLGGKSYGSQRTDQRLAAVFADAGFGTADYSLQTGQSTLVASGTFSFDSAALAHSQDVVATENGVLFVGGGGTLIFHDRHFRSKNRTTPSGTIGDVDGEIPYRDPVVPYGDDYLWNRAAVTPSGGTAETAIDASSTASFFTRTLTRSILASSQSEALSCAQYLVGRYKDPELRVEGCDLMGVAGTASWPTILGLEISDRLTWRRRPPGGGTITDDGYVELVGHDMSAAGDWVTPVRLSPVDSQTYWVLGDAVNGLLGQTTRLGY